MTDAIAEFQSIVKERNEAFARLSALEKPALKEVNRLINKRNAGHALSAQEQKDLASARSTLESVQHGIWIVGQISLQAMNDSALLRDIKNSLNGISRDLKGTTRKLDHIAKVASTAAQVTAAFVKLAERLGALLAGAA